MKASQKKQESMFFGANIDGADFRGVFIDGTGIECSLLQKAKLSGAPLYIIRFLEAIETETEKKIERMREEMRGEAKEIAERATSRSEPYVRPAYEDSLLAKWMRESERDYYKMLPTCSCVKCKGEDEGYGTDCTFDRQKRKKK